MRKTLIFVLLATVGSTWSATGFAQRQTLTVDGPIDADGIASGVDLVGNVTLSVGTVGGAETNIFTNNTSLAVTPPAVTTAASSTGNINFLSSSTVFGEIGVTPPGGPFLLNVFAAGDPTQVVNVQGSLFATTLNINTAGRVNLNNGATNSAATIFGSDGTLALAPNTTLIGAVTTTAGAQTGTLSLGSGSILDGAVGGAVGLRAINVVGGSNTAGISSTISGAANAFTFNLGTNTLNVGGALTIANGTPAGVINTTLASPTVFGNIRPTGATNLGSALQINVTVPDSAVIPVGTQFNIVQTADGTAQSGTDGSVVTATTVAPTNPLYSFSAVPPAGTVNGLVAIRTDAIPIQAPVQPPPGEALPPAAPIAVVVVPALVVGTTIAAPGTDLFEVLAPISAFTTVAAVVDAEVQLAPSTPDLVAPLVIFQADRQFQNLWQVRLDDVMCREVSIRWPDADTSACDKYTPQSGWWLRSFGYFGDQGTRGAFAGYDSRVLGVMAGYDMPIGIAGDQGFDTRAGLGLGYARTNIDGKVYDTSVNANTYQATAYLATERGPWFLNGSASMAWDEYSGKRNIRFPGVNRTANSDYSGQHYTLFATTGLHLLAQDFTVTPLASLQYTRVNVGSYTETGAGSVNLNVDSRGYDFLESGLGVRVARPFHDQGRTFVPEVHARWFHDFINPALKNTARFTGINAVSFTTPSLKTSDDTYNVGGGVTLLSCECSATKWAVEGVYDYHWRSDDYSAHQGMVKLTARF